MTLTLYSIRDWNMRFENNRTRELKRLDWVPIPNKQDGDGYTELMDENEGAAMYGCWVSLIQIASKCNPRGKLIRDNGEPHTAQSLSRMSRMPSGLLVRSLLVLTRIKWLDSIPYEMQNTIPQEGAGFPQEGALKGMEGKEWKEENGREDGANESPPTSDELSDEEWLLKLQTQDCYATITVRQEFLKMQNWCEANRKKPTRRRFVNWLNRCEKPMAKIQPGSKPDDRQRREVINVRTL